MHSELEALVTPVARLSRDLIKGMRQKGGGITSNEARFLVDLYYDMQRQRIRVNNQVKGLERDSEKSGNAAEPHEALTWTHVQFETLEQQVAQLLQVYVEVHPMAWFFEQSIGVGPIIAAGLLAHIDIRRAPTVGHIWNFAGLNPDVAWGKGEKRPWNAELKTICWKLGESFVKVSNKPGAIYGQIYANRKSDEWLKNLAGTFTDQCAAKLSGTNIGKTTDAYAWYSGAIDPSKVRSALEEGKALTIDKLEADDSGLPMLPPAHIHSRAKRYAVKMFLSHLHECWYRQEVGEVPKPFAIEHLGHAHYIAPPQRREKLPGPEAA